MFTRIFALIVVSCSLLAGQGNIAHANGVSIWYESFGDKQNPAVLLIMGACCQGVIWHTDFCKKLANEGFYVIRYDHRDAGLSTCFDFEKNPYDLMDLANDAIGVLDAAGIDSAHLFGVSMGSFIAELMAAHFPERIRTLLLLGSTCEIRPMNLALSGATAEESCSFSSPTQEYLTWMKEFTKLSAQTYEEKLNLRIQGWDRLNGQKIPLNAKKNREMQTTFLARLRHPQGIINHLTMLSSKPSEAIVRSIPSLVKVPTAIISGSEDPIYPPDHGKGLARLIENAEFILADGMGHIPNDHFYDLYISILKRQSSS